MEHYTKVSIACVYLIVILVSPAFSLQGCESRPMEAFQERIMGGRETTPHVYPWIALITHDGVTYCTGSILSDNWVITAANCLDGFDDKYDVIAGVHDVNENSGCQQIRHIYNEAVFRHEDFDSVSTLESLVNDIALIQVFPPFDIEDAMECVRTIEIYEDDPPIDGHFKVAGWGSKALNSEPENVLHEVEIPFVPDLNCSAAYDGISSYGDRLICAGVTGHSACVGDNGSPLFREDEDGEYRLHGVKSWSTGCGRSGCPDVYTEVSYFSNWINETIENSPIITITTPETTTPSVTTMDSGSSTPETTDTLISSTVDSTETTTASALKISFSYSLHIQIVLLIAFTLLQKCL